jgi:hypothetical protein
MQVHDGRVTAVCQVIVSVAIAHPSCSSRDAKLMGQRLLNLRLGLVRFPFGQVSIPCVVRGIWNADR